MGFFSKGSGSGTERRSSARSGEAQANELRVKARRRLVGALALVVAAVIVVPMLIDNDLPPGSPVSPIVLPAVSPLPDQKQINLAAANTAGSITIEQLPEPEAPEATQPAAPVSGAVATAPSAVTKPVPAPSVSAPAETRPAPKSEPARVDTKVARTDDGAVALALLEGRKPEAAAKPSAAASSGSYILQVAAYTTEQDASSRRSKLVESGVTNAFVEPTTVNGKKTWRLRVGPFPSREAAQAAQTRLRALGYGNGFISSK